MDPAQILQALQDAIKSGNMGEIVRLRELLAGGGAQSAPGLRIKLDQPVQASAFADTAVRPGPIRPPLPEGIANLEPAVVPQSLEVPRGFEMERGLVAPRIPELPGEPLPQLKTPAPVSNPWQAGQPPPAKPQAGVLTDNIRVGKPPAQPIPPPPSMANGGVSQAINADLAAGNAAMQNMDANMARAEAAMEKLRAARPNTSFSQVAAPYGAGAPPAGGTPTPGAAAPSVTGIFAKNPGEVGSPGQMGIAAAQRQYGLNYGDAIRVAYGEVPTPGGRMPSQFKSLEEWMRADPKLGGGGAEAAKHAASASAGAEAGAMGKYLDVVEGGDVTKVASSVPKTVPFGPEMGVNPSLLQRGLNAVKPALPFLDKVATRAGQVGAAYGVGKDTLSLVGAVDAARDPYAAPISNIASGAAAALDYLQPPMVKDAIAGRPMRPQVGMQGMPILQNFDPAGAAMSTANAIVNAVPGLAKSAYNWLTTAPERPVVPKIAPDLGPDGIPWNEEGKPFSMLDPLPPELARDPLGGAVPTPSKSTSRPSRPARPRVGGSAEKPDNFWSSSGGNSAAPTSMLGMKFHSDLIPEFGGSSTGNPGQQGATRTRFGGVDARGLSGPVAAEGFRAPLGTKDPTAYRDVTGKGTTQPFKHGSFFGAFDPTKPNVGALLDATGKVDPSKYTRSSVDPKTGILSPVAVDEDNTPFDADDMSTLAPGGDNSFLRNEWRRKALRPRARSGT